MHGEKRGTTAEKTCGVTEVGVLGPAGITTGGTSMRTATGARTEKGGKKEMAGDRHITLGEMTIGKNAPRVRGHTTTGTTGTSSAGQCLAIAVVTTAPTQH